MRCPFCGSPDVELLSPFGGQIITSQYRCRACSSYFEGVREDFEEEPRGFDDAREGCGEAAWPGPHG